MGKTKTSATGRQRGFTLMELLVVLAILAALTAAFPLAWQRLSPQRQVQVYARRLASDLGLARAHAMQRNISVKVSVTGAGHAYLVATDVSRELPGELRLQLLGPHASGNSESTDLNFYSDGSSSGGKFLLERDGRTSVVAVSALTGRVHLE